MIRSSLRTIRVGILALSAVAILAPGVAAQRSSDAITPTTTIKLFDGTSLANFDTWLVDHHNADPEHVYAVVDQIDGAPAIRISGKDTVARGDRIKLKPGTYRIEVISGGKARAPAYVNIPRLARCTLRDKPSLDCYR